ncbi:hypothetical protein G5V57_10705 [Nordella sp. HKS 07]|uniref:cadherin domain-containing protein n=1 Tax=Nordella sp. HKS 07 TaxID=2712222 RepID=UPI0013E1C4DC|nr:cadherin domain-containing protein [Nordella sp. HKS 07]QIG48153.1 hypothetical protein G5V57_10705 [Nordella sp. HKS 07]
MATFYVGSVAGSYLTIQAAINAASEGDIIVVSAGSYDEDLVIDKAVTILGAQEGAGATGAGRDAVGGTGETTIVGHHSITAGGQVVIDGVRFLNDGTTTGGGASDPTLEIMTSGPAGHPHIVTNSIFYSTAQGGAADDRAISISPIASGEIAITDNYFTGNQQGLFGTASWGRAVWLDGGGVDITISDNKIEFARTGINADLSGNSHLDVAGNAFVSTGTAVSGGINTDNLNITDNDFQNVGTDFNFRNFTTGVSFDAETAVDHLTPVSSANDYVVVLGGSGDDTLSGTDYADVLDGNNHPSQGSANDSDVLNGRGGNDFLYGRGGNDVLNGGAGNDIIHGGDGIDTAVVSGDVHAATDIHYNVGGATWTVTSADGTDTLDGVEVLEDAVGGKTLLVGGGGFATIQAALDAAADGDTIMLAAGTFGGPLTIDKQVTILGADGAVISGGVLVTADHVTIDGVDFTGAYNFGGLDRPYGLFVTGDHVSIANAVFTGSAEDTRPFGVGGTAADFSLSTSQITGWSEGAYLVQGAQGAITDNTFQGNGNGIVTETVDVTITGNSFSNSDGAHIVSLPFVDTNVGSTIHDNTFLDQDRPISIYLNGAADVVTGSDAGETIHGEYVAGPVTLNGAGGNDRLVGSHGNDIIHGGDGIDTAVVSGDVHAATDVHYNVGDATWTVTSADGTDTLDGVEVLEDAVDGKTLLVGGGGFATIQAALDAAADGDTIMLAAGTFGGPLTIDKQVTILGADGAVISGGVLVTADHVTIDGVDFTGAHNFGGLDRPYGLFVTGDHVSIANAVFTGSAEDTRPFGVGGTAADFSLSHSQITGWSEGAYIVQGAQGSITGNTFEHNGNGIVTETVDVTITGNSFSDSDGAHIAVLPFVDANLSSIGSDNTFLDQARPISVYLNGGAQTVTGSEVGEFITAAYVSGPVTLDGAGGNDRLVGSHGNDIIHGGDGIDTAVVSGDVHAATDIHYNVGGATWTVTSADGTDTLDGVEVLEDAVGGKTLLVGGGGFATIQAALDAAADGDTIMLAAGTFGGPLTIDKQVTILGADGAVISGGVLVTADHVTIDGVDFTGAYNFGGLDRPYGLFVTGDHVSIANAVFTGSAEDTRPFGVGGTAADFSLSTSQITGWSEGAYLVQGAQGAITDNTFQGNGNGIVTETVDVTITGNSFSNSDGAHIAVLPFVDADIPSIASDNTFLDQARPISIYLNGAADVVTGSNAGETIHGEYVAGPVTLDGAGGNDVLNGGAGNDSIDGGAGIDAANYSGDLSAADFTYDVSNGWQVSAGADGNDSLKGVEKVVDGNGETFFLVGGDSEYTTFAAAQAAGGIATTILTPDILPIGLVDSNSATNAVAEGAASGSSTGVIAHAADSTGTGISYSLADDAGGRFTIDQATGEITVANGSLLDFETATTHNVTVRATNGFNHSVDTTFMIEVTNSAPILVDSFAPIAENSTILGSVLTGIDCDDLTFAVAGPDAAKFQIDKNGILSFRTGPDFENPTDIGGNNVYNIVVVAADPSSAFITKSYAITVTDVAPGALSDGNASANTVAENAATGATVGITVVSATGGDAVTYTLLDNAGGRFAINPTTGVITVANGALLDFETATSHEVTVVATDGASTVHENFTINVGDLAGNTVTGTSAANVIDRTQGISGRFATDEDDIINGAGGNDKISGLGGNDNLTGGAGTDTISGGDGNDTFNVSGANDTYDTLSGDGGVDTLKINTAAALTLAKFNATTQSIEVLLGTNNNAINGTGAANTLDFSGLTAKSGVGVISGLEGNDTLIGSAFADSLRGGAGVDSVMGGDGDDTLLVTGTSDSTDILNGGSGTDTLKVEGTSNLTLTNFNASSQSVENWAGNNHGLIGTSAANTLDLSGLQSVNGLTFVDGSGGNDTLIGSAFADSLRGGAGVDSVMGGDGDDTLLVTGASDSTDILNGGSGTDTLKVEGTSNLTLTNFNASSQSIENWAGNNHGLMGTSAANTLDLSGLQSVNGLTFVDGSGGNDTIRGSNFNDVLRGGAGDDTIGGNAGNDTLTGNAGADTFIFATGGDADIITDFVAGTDQIDLTGVADVDTFGDLQMTQVGSAVVIDFGGGDKLTVNNMTIATLVSHQNDFLF